MSLSRMLCLPLLAAAPLALAATAGDPANATRTFSRNVPAAGLTSVSLNVGVGDIHVTTANIPVVRVQATAQPGNHAHFIFNWTFGPAAGTGLPADLHLVTARRGSQLVLCLASATSGGCILGSAAPGAGTGIAGSEQNRVIVGMPGHGMSIDFGNHQQSSWKANWTLVLPTRLALALEAGVGDATVAGVGGGLNVQLGVGNVNATLPRGPLKASVGVGDLKVAVASADYGDVSLNSGVGDIAFTVNGRKNTTGFEHHFTSASQDISGPGQTAYTLKAGVGHIELSLGAQGASGTTDEEHPQQAGSNIAQN